MRIRGDGLTILHVRVLILTDDFNRSCVRAWWQTLDAIVGSCDAMGGQFKGLLYELWLLVIRFMVARDLCPHGLSLDTAMGSHIYCAEGAGLHVSLRPERPIRRARRFMVDGEISVQDCATRV